MMKLLLIFLFLQLRIREGTGRPEACIEHLSYQNSESSSECSSDYIITAEAFRYTIGQPIKVTVRSITAGTTFTDVTLVARDGNNRIVGYWKTNSHLLSIGSCGEIVQNSNAEKNSVHAIWQTNSKIIGNVKIQAYIGKSDKTRFINCYNLTLTPNIATAEPNILAGINVTWTFNPGNITRVYMTIVRLKTSEWAAIGLNLNRSMGGTHAFICKRRGDNTVTVNRYLNPGDHNPPEPAGSEDGGIFTVEKQVFDSGIVYCQFTLSNFSATIPSKLRAIPPLSQSTSYHPICAAGPLDSQNEVQWHGPFSRSAFSYHVQLNATETITFQMGKDQVTNK